MSLPDLAHTYFLTDLRGCVCLSLHQQPINKIIYADMHIKGIISSIRENFFSIIREPFSVLVSSFFLAHISFSPSAFSDSIPHLGHPNRKDEERKSIACHSCRLTETTAR